MIKLTKAKNTTYEKIRDIKLQLQEVKDEIKQHEKFILKKQREYCTTNGRCQSTDQGKHILKKENRRT